MITVNVAREFTRFPAGRYAKNGDTSGEAFRENFLLEPLRKGESVFVDLDGTVGYGSSFLEEAFGGIVRQLHIAPETLLAQLTFRSADPTLVDEVEQYIRDAGRELHGDVSRVRPRL